MVAIGRFPEVSPLTRDFLLHLTRKDAPRKLWRHQEEAVMRAVYARELLQWRELLLNIVTGGGKTAIIGAVIAWLKTCHDLHKFVLLCPNTIVRDRLEDDFKDAKVFRDFGFLPPGMEHFTNELGLHVMEPGAGPQGIRDCGVVLGNIQQLYQSNSSGERNLAVLMNYGATDRGVQRRGAQHAGGGIRQHAVHAEADFQVPAGHDGDARPGRRQSAGYEDDFRVWHHGRASRSAAHYQKRGGVSTEAGERGIDLHEYRDRREAHGGRNG